LSDSKTKKPDWVKHLNCIFGYCFIWSFGVNFKQSAERFLDSMMRDLFFLCRIPSVDTVFDYKFDEKQLVFTHWKEFLPEKIHHASFDSHFQSSQEDQTLYYKMVVQSVDTLRFTSVLKTLASGNKAVFFTGPSGTGKSIIIENYIASSKEH